MGALGKLTFEKGLYAYVGSAQRNLEKRINRHFRKNKQLFWHIDYLLNSDAARIVEVFYKDAVKNEECAIARQIDGIGKRVDGFGCSDCDCKSHLFHVNDMQKQIFIDFFTHKDKDGISLFRKLK